MLRPNMLQLLLILCATFTVPSAAQSPPHVHVGNQRIPISRHELQSLLQQRRQQVLAQVTPDDSPPPTSQEPVAVVTGPKAGRPGQIVILDASGSKNATGFAWLIETDATVPAEEDPRKALEWASALKSMGWKVQEPDNPGEPLWLLSSDNQRVILATYPGTYRAILAVGNPESDTPSVTSHTFESIGVGSPPPDDPPPDDTPPLPPDFDFEDESRDWASEVTFHRARLPDLGLTFVMIGSLHPFLPSKAAIDEQLTETLRTNFANEIGDWETLSGQIDRALSSVRDRATLAEYGATYVSIGKGLIPQ